MELELKDEKGLIGTIELPLEKVKEALGLGSASVAEPTETEAQLKENQGKVAELQEKLATAEGRTMADFTPAEKADFVIAWGKGLSPEDKAVFAQAVGLPIAGAAEVAEVEGEPKTIQGKTDKPGYKYYEYLNISMKE